MAELQSRLRVALGDTYRIEKELGGGGMSRVFLAEEAELGRRVVIKVLPPEMAAGVNVERFRREIQLAAKLQHPHVVPLLTAGSDGDLLYYIMPFIEGESLRHKLSREGELPVGEAVRILREVVDALAYAHRHNVVHRDIKPDNVLLSEGHAVVTDFGVAKAVSASTGESSLTSLGVALGTPAYMAPEQAAADPHVDHRADIYAVGVLAYEMLSGRPPFTGSTAQAVLSAHMTQEPEPVTAHRTTVPAALNQLILQCLAKKAADRWQRTEELLPPLEALLTPSGGVTPTSTQPVPAVDYDARARQAHPVRVAALFSAGAMIVLGLVYLITIVVGLPDWVLVAGVILIAIGLPIVLVTGYHERRRALAGTTGIHVTTPAGVRRHFTWRKAFAGGAVAFAGLALLTTGFMASRVFGIGPAATLVTSGMIEERSEVLLAEFENHASDSTLGHSLTTAFRVDLGQSKVVKLVDQSTVTSALRRMERDPATELDSALAREIAEREGIPILIAGDVSPIGQAYVITASVLSTANGEILTAARETAGNDAELIPAIEHLSLALRERIGESLKDIRANPPLERVTTASMDALRTYSQALAAEDRGDFRRSIALLEEAVTVDTAFAMAYRKLAVIRGNTFESFPLVVEAMRRAFEHRDRLPDVERYLTEARFYGSVEGDREKEMDAYRSVLAIDPEEVTSLNNLANELNAMRRYGEAETFALRAMEQEVRWPFYANAVAAQVGQGKWDAAGETVRRMAADMGEESPHVARFGGDLAAARGDFERAAALAHQVLDTHNEAFWQVGASLSLAGLARMQGQVREAAVSLRRAMTASEGRNLGGYLTFATELAQTELRFHDDRSAALQTMKAALDRYPLSEVPALDRPYTRLASFYADAGEPARARALLDEYRRQVDEPLWRANRGRYGAQAALAVAEDRLEDAVALYRQWHEAGDGFCRECALYRLGDVFDRLGQPDSAIAAYQAAVSARNLWRTYEDPLYFAPAHRRLGELYEQTGHMEEALEYYNAFVDLWKNADPELQPQVTEVKQRIAALVGENRGEM